MSKKEKNTQTQETRRNTLKHVPKKSQKIKSKLFGETEMKSSNGFWLFFSFSE